MAEYGKVALTVIGGIPGNEIGVVIDIPCAAKSEAIKNEFIKLVELEVRKKNILNSKAL